MALVGLTQDEGSTWSTVPTWPAGLEGSRGPSRGIAQHPPVGHIWVSGDLQLDWKFLDFQVLAANENGKKENHRAQALCMCGLKTFSFQMRCLL